MGGHQISPRLCPEQRVPDACERCPGEGCVKNSEEVMEILEAFDATGSLRAAAELVGCDHKTVGHWVKARDAAGGGLPVSIAIEKCR
jgi:hypothetical protein